MSEHSYRTVGTCSQQIDFELENGKVKNVRFIKGCNGNTQGVALLVEGMAAEELIAKLGGLQCGVKGTSCPDQLARAVRAALAQGNSAAAPPQNDREGIQ